MFDFPLFSQRIYRSLDQCFSWLTPFLSKTIDLAVYVLELRSEEPGNTCRIRCGFERPTMASKHVLALLKHLRGSQI